jgi:hypothetical protein
MEKAGWILVVIEDGEDCCALDVEVDKRSKQFELAQVMSESLNILLELFSPDHH